MNRDDDFSPNAFWAAFTDDNIEQALIA